MNPGFLMEFRPGGAELPYPTGMTMIDEKD